MFIRYLFLVFGLLAFPVSGGDQSRIDLDLGLCVNGELSASGTFPTQAMGEEVDVPVTWSAENGRFR